MTAIERQVRIIDADKTASRRIAQKMIARRFSEAASHAHAATRLGVDPAQAASAAVLGGNTFARDIGRVMFVSYLDGVRRMLRDAEKASGKRIIGRETIMLDRAKKETEDLVAWLLALLGVSKDDAERIESQFVRQAEPIVRNMTNPIARRLESIDPAVEFGERRAAVTEAFRKTGMSKAEAWAFRGWSEIVVNRPFEMGRFDAAQYPAVSEMVWGYHYSAILDSRTTTMCRSLDGWVARADDLQMKAMRPPNHFRCRSMLIPVWQSSALKTPEPHKTVTDAELNLYVAKKEAFLRYLA